MIDFWDKLKNLPIPIVALLLGVVLFYLGMRDESLNIQGIDFHLTQTWTRITSSIVGVFIIISALVVAVMLKRSEKTADDKAASKNISSQTKNAENFFSTVVESNLPFPKMVEGATELYILSITAVNLLNHHFDVFEKLGKNGCKLKFLFLNPASNISQSIYGGNPNVFKNNVSSTIESLNKLKSICGKNLEVRTINFSPTIGIILIMKEASLISKNYFAHIQLYFLRGAIGANRPVFKVQYEDKWFQTFKDEFDKLWKEGNNLETAKN